jgi:hypothetical protein
MPRDAHSAAKAVDMLDLLIEFFDDGEHWIKGKLDDGAGNRCLVGALRVTFATGTISMVRRPALIC